MRDLLQSHHLRSNIAYKQLAWTSLKFKDDIFETIKIINFTFPCERTLLEMEGAVFWFNQNSIRIWKWQHFTKHNNLSPCKDNCMNYLLYHVVCPVFLIEKK